MAGNEVLVTPPIRQSVEDANSAAANGITQPSTEKSWYLFWDGLGKAANRQAGMIRYGTHADRPDPANVPDGALYVETDRGVIYQKINGQWKYLAGTMWGTLSPDQRPTDLGMNDEGFTFHGTDYPREFIWNGTAWIEDTPVRWGTHAERLALDLTKVIDGELFVEADRSDVVYQNQGGHWHYITGTMWGTLSPDQRPTDLGPNDVDFQFGATDTKQIYRWDGTTWVLMSGASDIQLAAASGSLALTTTRQDIPGAQLTLANAGVYLIRGVFEMILSGAGDQSSYLMGGLNFNGSDVGMSAELLSNNAVNLFATVAQQWLVTASTPGMIVKLRGWKSGGTGSSIIGVLTTISAECVQATAGSGGGGGAVTSVFARSGNVIAQTGDYNAAQVTNAVSTIGTYADPAWITSLAWSKITGAPATGVSTVFGRSGAVAAVSGDYTVAQITGAVPNTVQVIAGTGLTGGGPLSSNVTLNALVTSVFGRTGAVVAASGDYTAAQITNAVSTIGSYPDPAWITSLAWSKLTPAPTLAYATCSSNLTLTGALQTVPGLSVTLTKTGTYLIQASIYFNQVNEYGMQMIVIFVINGVNQGPSVVFMPAAPTGSFNQDVTAYQQLSYVASSAPQTVIMQAYKTGGAGTSYIGSTHSTLSALWVSP